MTTVAASVIAAVAIALSSSRHACGRACRARMLMQSLRAAGATIGVALDVLDDTHGGVGVHVVHAVRENTTLVRIPRKLWLTSANCPTAVDSDCPGFAQGGRLLLALGRERRRPSTAVMAAYLHSLPTSCPANLAARRGTSWRTVAANGRHAWRVTALQEEEELLKSELPVADEAERRLLTCLGISRAFNDLSEPPPAAAVHPRFGYCRAAMVPLCMRAKP